MENIKVKKADLLHKLKTNREAHRQIFEEAVKGYYAEGVRILQQHIEDIKRGSLKRVIVNLPVPSDHTEDYNRAIEMLEMTLDQEIEVSERDFEMFVRDNWLWKQEFLASNSTYSVRARNENSRMYPT